MNNLSNMKAIITNGMGGTEVLEYQEIPIPKPGPHDLLVKVYAAGVNRLDIVQRIGGVYQLPPNNSPILGLEIAGEVVQIGSEVNNFKPGDKVFGYVNGGGYAQYCLQDAGFAITLPAHWNFIEGAAVAETAQSANEALFTHGKLMSGETVLIHAGASGVGTFAIQMAKAMGAVVIVTVGSNEKVNFCRSLHADCCINYKTQDFVKEVLAFTHNHGADVILDCVGPAYFNKNIECLAFDGRLIMIGLLSGAKGEMDLVAFLKKRVMMKGNNLRGRELVEQRAVIKRLTDHWLKSFQQGNIKPIIDKVFPIEQVALAHQYMEENLNIGKIILEVKHE